MATQLILMKKNGALLFSTAKVLLSTAAAKIVLAKDLSLRLLLKLVIL